MLEKINSPEDIKKLNIEEKKKKIKKRKKKTISRRTKKIYIRSSIRKWRTPSIKFGCC